MTGRRSAVTSVQGALAAIAEREPSVRAWTYVDADGALDRARGIDATPLRALSGLTFGLKDLIDTADMPTSYGSTADPDRRPHRDADVVGLIQAVGGCIIGKTVTTEFALMTPGPTHNPHRTGHTPGGSSSGSAAAVAAGMVDVGIGTQTYGSMIRPAGYCGVYGYTPTYGAVSMTGICPMAPSYDKIGWYTRSLDELELVYTGLIGELDDDSSSSRLRVGAVALDEWPDLSPDVRTAMSTVRDHLAESADVISLDLRSDLTEVIRLHHIIASSEIAVARREQVARGILSAPVGEFVAAGAAVTDARRIEATALLADLRARVLRVFQEVDVVITPSTTGEAPAGLEYTGDPVFCTPWTALGSPALAVPMTTGSSGLPLGVQLVAAPGRDCRAFRSARALRLSGLRPGR